jgi:hypothetical protein
VCNWATLKVELLLTFQLKTAWGKIHGNFNAVIVFEDIIRRPVFIYNTQRFGDWILSPSSGGTYSVGLNR